MRIITNLMCFIGFPQGKMRNIYAKYLFYRKYSKNTFCFGSYTLKVLVSHARNRKKIKLCLTLGATFREKQPKFSRQWLNISRWQRGLVPRLEPIAFVQRSANSMDVISTDILLFYCGFGEADGEFGYGDPHRRRLVAFYWVYSMITTCCFHLHINKFICTYYSACEVRQLAINVKTI